MKAVVETGSVETVAIFDPSPEMAAAARELTPEASVVNSLEALLDQELDGIVIASPSALHAAQSIVALEQGVAVFCQKPLGRTRDETAAVVETARHVDRLLSVDLSYRYTEGMRQIRDLIASGELGTVFAVDLIFHNAYGPSKPWFYDKALSGGGCVIDLGVHLVDLLLWVLGFPDVVRVESRLFAKGLPIRRDGDEVEDYAVATVELANGVLARIACSWHLQAGCDAVISADFYGTKARQPEKRQRIVSGLHGRTLSRHARRGACGSPRRLGWTRGGRLGREAGRRGALRSRQRVSGHGGGCAGQDLWAVGWRAVRCDSILIPVDPAPKEPRIARGCASSRGTSSGAAANFADIHRPSWKAR